MCSYCFSLSPWKPRRGLPLNWCSTVNSVCIYVCRCAFVHVCLCVCEYMKGLWGKLKCQRGSIYDTVHGIGWHQPGRTERGRKNRQTTKKRFDEDGSSHGKHHLFCILMYEGVKWKTRADTKTHTRTLDDISVYQCHVFISQLHPSSGAICTDLTPVALGKCIPLFASTRPQSARAVKADTRALPFKERKRREGTRDEAERWRSGSPEKVRRRNSIRQKCVDRW